jgi:hypothetical protein
VRRLAILLLLGNFVLFLAYRYESPVEAASPVDPSATAPKILLASERPAPKPECRSVGPFASRLLMTKVSQWMADRFGPLTERDTTVAAPPAYRVQIETQSADQAARLAQRLRAAAVGDIAVLAPEPGETAVIVAMGLFSERANADRRVVELRRFAVEARIAPIERHASQWWLDFTALESPDLAALAREVPTARDTALAPCEATVPADEGPADTTKPGPSPKPGGLRSSGAAV